MARVKVSGRRGLLASFLAVSWSLSWCLFEYRL